MSKRNLTIHLDDDVIHRAKVTAARRGTSVSGLVTMELERLVAADERYDAARDRAERAMGRQQAVKNINASSLLANFELPAANRLLPTVLSFFASQILIGDVYAVRGQFGGGLCCGFRPIGHSCKRFRRDNRAPDHLESKLDSI